LCFGIFASCSKTTSPSNASPPAHDQSSGPIAGQPSSKSESDEAKNTNNEIADQLHTPLKGTQERQAIMDGLREDFDNRQGSFYKPHRGAIVFVVNRLQVHNGWAWMIGYPQSSDSQDSFGEYNGFLLHYADGRWRAMSPPPMVNDPNDPENLDYPNRRDVDKIPQKFPTAPRDIFQK
jgi:hypothetical protein